MIVAAVGSGWVFLLNAASYGVTIVALLLMRRSELRRKDMQAGQVKLSQGVSYLRRHRDLLMVLVLVFGVGTFGLNYQITMALMANQEFEVGAAGFGIMSTSLAFGALIGSLLAARRGRSTMRLVVGAALVFGAVEIVVGLVPTYLSMLVVLPLAGACALTFTTSSQSYLQSNAAGWVRGRVLGHLHARLLRRHPDRGAGHRLGGRAVRAAQRSGRRRRRDRGVDPRGCRCCSCATGACPPRSTPTTDPRRSPPTRSPPSPAAETPRTDRRRGRGHAPVVTARTAARDLPRPRVLP